MAIWSIIPTCDDPMSIYTAVLFGIMISGNIIAFSLMIRWSIREFTRIDNRLGEHGDYIDDASKIINQMSTDIAVTREAVENLEAGMKDIKKSIATMNQTIIDKLFGK